MELNTSFLSEEIQRQIANSIIEICSNAVEKAYELQSTETRYIKESKARIYCDNASYNTFQKWVREGELDPIRIYGKVLYDKKDLDVFMLKHKETNA